MYLQALHARQSRGRRAPRACAALGVALLALAPLARAADGDAVALVNGTPVLRRDLIDLLVESHGLEILQQLIVLELARQETRRLELRVSPEDVSAEYQRALDRIAPPADAHGVTLSEAEKKKALDQVLAQKGLSLAEFMLTMERNAHLRKVADARFRVDDETLREQFARQYGERVEIRHIQVNDANMLMVVQNELMAGRSFDEVARKYSQNPETAAKGGLMEPFAYNDERIPPVLREAAFTMHVNDISNPLRVEQRIHILRLERRIPPENAKFEDVREQVLATYKDRFLQRTMNQLATELFQKSQVRVLEPRLKSKYEELLKQSPAVEAAPR